MGAFLGLLAGHEVQALADIRRHPASRRMDVRRGPWWRCHRRLVADVLVAHGWTVSHLSPRGEVERRELTEFAVLEGGRVTYPPPQAALHV